MLDVVYKKWLPLALVGLGLIVWWHITLTYSTLGGDFDQDYVAAYALRHGMPIYGSHLSELAKTIGKAGAIGVENMHPPLLSVLFLPLSFLSYQNAFILWSVFQLGLFFGLIWAVVQGLQMPRTFFLYTVGLGLCWYPFQYAIGTGNSSLLVSALVIACWYSLVRKRAKLAGVFLGLSTMLKLFPGLLLIYLLLTKQFRTLAVAIATILTVGVGLLGIVGTSDFYRYFSEIMAQDVARWSTFILNQSIAGVVLPFFITSQNMQALIDDPALGHTVVLALNLILLIWLCYLSLRVKAADADDSTRLFCLYISSMLLMSPITWAHNFPVLILPLLFLSRQYPGMGMKYRFVLLLAAVCLSVPDVEVSRWVVSFDLGAGTSMVLFPLTKLPLLGLGLVVWLLSLVSPFQNSGGTISNTDLSGPSKMRFNLIIKI